MEVHLVLQPPCALSLQRPRAQPPVPVGWGRTGITVIRAPGQSRLLVARVANKTLEATWLPPELLTQAIRPALCSVRSGRAYYSAEVQDHESHKAASATSEVTTFESNRARIIRDDTADPTTVTAMCCKQRTCS
jgi:hypothetical protein